MNSVQTVNPEILRSALKKEKPSLLDRILLCGIFLASLVYLPSLLSVVRTAEAQNVVSFAMCALSVLSQILLSKQKLGAIGHALLLLAVGFLCGSVHVAAILGALICAACIFTWLALSTGAPSLVLLPLAGYVLATVMTKSLFLGALALVAMPLCLTLLLTVRSLRPRLSALCLLSGSILLTAALAAILCLLLIRHGISAELIRGEIEAFRGFMIRQLHDRLSLLEGELSLIPAGMEQAAYVEMLVNDLINHLPALLILLSNGIAYATQSAMTRILAARKSPKEALKPMIVFDVSAASSAVYLLALLLALALRDPSVAMYGTVAENLYLILIPPMLITFWMFLNLLVFRKAPSCFGILFYLAIPFLIFQFPALTLPVTATVGAIVNLVGKIRAAFLTRKFKS